MRFSNVFGMLAVGSMATAALLAGCGDDNNTTGSGGSAATSSSSSTGSGSACDPKGPVCTAVDSDCLALKNNKGAETTDLRMAQLTITAPKVLAEGTIATTVAGGVQMKLPECNLEGGGTFSWLLQITSDGKMKTGGAKPVTDPLAGYCFVNETLGNFPIAPITVEGGLTGQKFNGAVGDIVVPIYLSATSYVLLPLHSVVIEGEISADNNCIGKYNADTLDPAANCLAEPPEKLAFTNAGKLDGYLTVSEADDVVVDLLGQSLCVLLSGNAGMYGDGNSPAKCKRDPDTMEILFKGDWCSKTNMAATTDCADAMRLGAEFAASGVTITGECK